MHTQQSSFPYICERFSFSTRKQRFPNTLCAILPLPCMRPLFFFQRYKRMMMIKMMMKRSVLIQLACLALVGLVNAAYDFQACSDADCGQECSGEYCACKSREACVLSLHRRWVCCSCLYLTILSALILGPVFQILTFFAT